MAQDFAKNKPSAPRKKSGGGGSAPGWVWLSAGVILGAFIAFLVYLTGLTPQKTADKKSATTLPPVEEHSEKPTFEFYDRLMNTEVIDNKKHPASNTTTSPGNTTNATYILQAAAFQKQQDADALKAKLILDGLDTSIQKFDNNKGDTFYRVLVGPISSPDKLSQAKTILAQHSLNPIVLQQQKK